MGCRLTAVSMAREGGFVGRVGVPQADSTPASRTAFFGNISMGGGPTPVRVLSR